MEIENLKDRLYNNEKGKFFQNPPEKYNCQNTLAITYKMDLEIIDFSGVQRDRVEMAAAH